MVVRDNCVKAVFGLEGFAGVSGLPGSSSSDTYLLQLMMRGVHMHTHRG